MSMDAIKQAVTRKEGEMDKPSGIFAPSHFTDEIREYMRSPNEENGKPLPWRNVKLTLKNELYLLTGIPSMGKSTWMDNIIVHSAMQHKFKWAIYSPESYPVKRYLAKLIWTHMGVHIHGRYQRESPNVESVMNSMKFLDSAAAIINPDEQEKNVDDLLERVEWLVKYEGVNAFLFDPYNEFSASRPRIISETEYVSLFLGRIRSFVNTHQVMAWIVAHPTKLKKEEVNYPDGSTVMDYAVPTAYDVAGSANFYNKPDNIIAVHRNRNKEQNPENIVQIVVQKARNGGDCQEGEYLLKYNYITNSFYEYVQSENGRYE